MTVLGVGGVLIRFTGRMGWGSRRILGEAPKFDFGMMFGVGIKLSRHLFWTCLALPNL